MIDDHDPTEQLKRTLLACKGQYVDIDPTHVAERFRPFSPPAINLRQVSNTLKHRAALTRIGASNQTPHELRFSLVVEDDALYTQNLRSLLARITRDAPADADIVFVSLPSPPSEDLAFPALDALFRTPPACDAYLVTPRAAEAMARAMLPVRMPTPSHLHCVAHTLGLRMYVSSHNVFLDGSKIGAAVSSIQPNNLLIWNQPFCRLADSVAGSKADASLVTAALEEFALSSSSSPNGAQFAAHPDVWALHARCLRGLGRHEEALALFEKAYAAYVEGEAILDISSGFLREYMALFEHLQPDLQSAEQ
jgi:tetratricopeptide (TPR) repeat protein